jgi:hypothetical protein
MVEDRIRFGVGGLFPDPNCAVLGTSDYLYTVDGKPKFCTEMKTSSAYSSREPWYRQSRACQSLGAMFYSGLPVLLCSPDSYKLLFTTTNDSATYGFPTGQYSGDTQGPDFPYVVGLLLLSTLEAKMPLPFAPAVPAPALALRIIGTTPMKQSATGTRRSERLATKTIRLASSGSSSDVMAPGHQLFILTLEEIDSAFASMEESAVYPSVIGEHEELEAEQAQIRASK